MAFNVAATVTLSSYRNASLFWIMLWLVSGPGDHGMIPAGLHAQQQLGRQLCPQLRVYCCIAASEVMGHFRTTALQKKIVDGASLCTDKTPPFSNRQAD
jgi:hypothetical protein